MNEISGTPYIPGPRSSDSGLVATHVNTPDSADLPIDLPRGAVHA